MISSQSNFMQSPRTSSRMMLKRLTNRNKRYVSTCHFLVSCSSSSISQASMKATRKKKKNPNFSSDQSLSQSALGHCSTRDSCQLITRRRKRETISEREKMAQDTEEALKRKEMELEERRKQSHDLVAESIRRELAESKCGSLYQCNIFSCS